MIKRACLVISLLLCSSVFAHQDRIITLESNGDLTGLPEQYLPANFNEKTHTLSIAKNTFAMPVCISKYFSFSPDSTLKITSSWYHQRSILPPYINFKISPNDKDYAFSLLIGLDDLAVIEATVTTYFSKNSGAFHQIKIDERCQEAIKNSYAKK